MALKKWQENLIYFSGLATVILTMLLFSTGIVASAVIGAVLVAGLNLFFLLITRRRNRLLSGGLDSISAGDLTEMQWLRVVVKEETERYRRIGLFPKRNRNHYVRMALTAGYILLVFIFLCTFWYKIYIFRLLTLITLAYTIVFYCFDPERVICKAIRKEPDRPFGEIVSREMTETAPRSLIPVGIGAFLLAIGLSVMLNSQSRMEFVPTEGGYCVAGWRPGISDLGGNVQLPETYNDQPVVAIGPRAFEKNSCVKTLQIPATVTHIDSYAFKKCERLKSVTLPENLLTLNGESFKGCIALEKITIPAGVTEIRGNTFEDCTRLKTVVLHDGIVDIHAYAFRNCKRLENIKLPAGIREISAYTFENCRALEFIVIPKGVTSIRAHAFYNCTSLIAVDLPMSITEIRSSAFRQCTSLKSIEIPKNAKVDERAFKDSPTVIREKNFTEEQLRKINAEAEARETVDCLYYAHEAGNPDAICEWEDGTVLLVDDGCFAEKMNEDSALTPLHNYQEVLEFLQKAKQAGFTKVLYGRYNAAASEIAGVPWFFRNDRTVDDMIAITQQQIGEGND